MRKILTVFIAVWMLVATLAALPVAAAELADYEVSEKDGSTVEDAAALDLVVTEMMTDTTSTVGNNPNANAFQYVEVYNRGTTVINLYNLAVVRGANNMNQSVWREDHMFSAMLPIRAGNVYNGTSAKDSSQECVNPGSAMLEPGKFAIIWFWNDASIQASKDISPSPSLGAVTTSGSKNVYHKGFRDHYNSVQGAGTVSDDLLIVAVYAGTSTDTVSKSTFDLNTKDSYMYGLVKNEPGYTFDYKDERAYQSFYDRINDVIIYERNDKVVCLWRWGIGTNLSIPTGTAVTEGMASTYVPANCTPDLRNATRRANRGDTYVDKHNYYELGFVDSFKELGFVSFEERPTVGSMEAWQWAYVDPDRAPADVKALATGGKTWQEVAIAAHNAALLRVAPEVPAHPEVENPIQKEIVKNYGQQGNDQQVPMFDVAPAQIAPTTASLESELTQNSGATQKSAQGALWVIALVLPAVALSCGAGYFLLKKKQH